MKDIKFEKWIRKQIGYYAPIIGVEMHEIKIEFRKTTDYIEIDCTYPYLNPKIYYSDKAIENFEKGEVESHRILHELCHILTDPLYCKAITRFVSENEIKDERENLTDKITAIIRKILG